MPKSFVTRAKQRGALLANQQFVVLENSYLEKLKKEVAFSFWEKYDETHTVVRFVTSWSTTDEDLNQLEKILKQI